MSEQPVLGERGETVEVYELVGKDTGEVYSTFIPCGDSDEETAHNLNAEFDIIEGYYQLSETLSVRLSSEQ